jgi:murein DD-endopeptidase MepM/ murein hydrolase activator NlpD
MVWQTRKVANEMPVATAARDRREQQASLPTKYGKTGKNDNGGCQGMDTGQRGTLRRIGNRLVPEREIFFRSRGRVRFIRLSRRSQIVLLALLLSAAGSATFVSVKSIGADRIVAGLEQRMVRLVANYHALSVELRAAQEKVAGLRGGIDSKQRELYENQRARADLAEQKTVLEKALGVLRGDLATVSRRRAELIAQKSALDGALDVLTGDLRRMTEERDMARASTTRMSKRAVRLERALTGTARTRDRLTNRVRNLEMRLAMVEPAQRKLVARMRQYAESSTGDLEEMIALTGLDADALLEETGGLPGGQGGPYIRPNESEAPADMFRGLGDDLDSSVLALESNFSRWNDLQSILQGLPLTAPVDSYYVSSPFGKRIDPFTKRKAMHYGIDLAGVLKTAVWSTAPGVVTYVGSDGAYGGSVEIDHGRGITTRYSHLHKILVKKGETVPFRHKIGLMGNSGRSTGAHVHYEIRFKGVPQDPAKFMKAGKYVFKT